MVNDLTLCT
jgi:aldehyde dehydrogenase (NAD+)